MGGDIGCGHREIERCFWAENGGENGLDAVGTGDFSIFCPAKPVKMAAGSAPFCVFLAERGLIPCAEVRVFSCFCAGVFIRGGFFKLVRVLRAWGAMEP